MKVLIFLFNITFCVFLALIAFIYITPSHPYAELLSHFILIFSFISAFYVVVYGICRRKVFIGLALVACVLTAYPWVSLLKAPPSPARTQRGEDISILQFNIHYINQDIDQFVRYVRELNFPDIIVIQEATPEIQHDLRSLKAHYPYRVEAPEEGAYGMILFSKLPIIKAEQNLFKTHAHLYTVIEFTTLLQHIPFTLIELHAISPTRDPLHQRKQELEEIGTILSLLPNEHKMLVGDLNTTPYSAYFRNLQEKSGLQNAMQGLRTEGTWPSFLLSFLRIPLDHLLVSKTIGVVSQTIGPDLGSDHMSVLSRVRLYASDRRSD